MKYIIASLCLAMFTSCSWSNPFGRDPDGTNIPLTLTGSVGTYGSGTISGDQNDTNSTQTGKIITPPTDTQSGVTTVLSGQTMTSSGRDMPATKSGAIKIQTGTANKTDMDPEIQNITDDINKIFDDIGKEGK